jgi:histidinol phosphatase-like enzyme
MSPTKKRYVLLHRDGVINQRMAGGYATPWNPFEFLPRVPEELRPMADRDHTAILLSNQTCVGEGFVSSQDLDVITHRFMLEVALLGGVIAQMYCRQRFQDECAFGKARPSLLRRLHLEYRLAPETTELS